MKSRSFNLFVILALFLSLLGSAVTFTPAYAAGIVVNSNADNTTVDGLCTLREAIANANNDAATNPDCTAGAGADTITFAADYTITLFNSELPVISSEITINGNGATKTIIQASTCNPITLPGGCTPAYYRVFRVSNTGGNLTLDGLTIQNGNCRDSCELISNFGGGIYNLGTLKITNSIISNNSASFVGGGIYNIGTATLINVTFSDNRGVNGGGMSNLSTIPATLTNVTFSGNISNRGGGVYNATSSPTLTNVTFSGNSATTFGGGIYNSASSPTLTNVIIANSTSGGDCSGSSLNPASSNNLIEDAGNACGLTNGSNGNIIGSAPNLGPLADNGGFTKTFALQPGSPAIDAGTNTGCSTTDQRGTARPQGSVCDIGAYEANGGIPIVTASNPSANAVLTSLSSITVVFNQDMLNDGSAKAANNTVNYLLVERGTNGSFDTTSCNGGVVSDDVQQTISTANYSSAGFITTLTLASPLANGTYRLFICGTTSIWSVAGLELNNGANDATVDFTIGAAGGTTSASTARTTASSLPKTGFAPGKVTVLPAQPATLEYAKLGDLWLEIPSLNVKSSIVGVPQNADKTWDVSWLGEDTGWLNGTAFPTWTGNSVLTAHVTNASGVNGPFAALKSLKYGDQIIVHMGGVKYVYEVRETKLSRPYSTNYAFKSKQDASYITLVTCSGYNPLNESYLFRRVVRAVLVSTLSE